MIVILTIDMFQINNRNKIFTMENQKRALQSFFDADIVDFVPAFCENQLLRPHDLKQLQFL